MPEQPGQPQGEGFTPFQDAKQAIAMFVFAAQALAAPVEPFLRTRFGSKYFGMPSLVGMFAVPMWMLFWPGESSTPLMVFWCLYLVMQLRARLESVRMVARGDFVHTRYNGFPRLAKFFTKSSERTIKAGLEPVAVIFTGVMLLPLSEPLGSYLMLAGISLALSHSVMEAVERARALELHDSFIEEQQLSEDFRAMTKQRRR